MKVNLLVVLFLFFSQFSFSQKEEMLKGKVFNQNLPIKGVAIINFNNRTYNLIDFNHNYSGALINPVNNSQPSLYWLPYNSTDAKTIYLASKIIDTYSVDFISISIFKNISANVGIQLLYGDGNQMKTIILTNPVLTYTKDDKNRITGTFSSDQANGSFTNIVKQIN